MVTRTFEIYMLHELDSDEEAYLHRTAINLEIDLSIAHSNRLITIEGMRDIYEVIHFLMNDFLLAEDIGNIREIVDYEPLFEPRIIVEFE